jgi:tetratricopeptide (TPR) repeat protein
MSNAVQPIPSATAVMESSDRPAGSGNALRRAILVGVVLVTFCQACCYDFVNIDDYIVLPKNPLMNPPTLHSLRVWWTTAPLQLYDPVTWTVQGAVALLARVSPDPVTGDDLNPWVFHAFNILLHIGVTLLVYQILQELKIRPWPACGGALLFGIHPVQVEPVVWITAIKDLLHGSFGLLAIWRLLVSLGSPSDIPATEIDRSRKTSNYLLATLCFVLAMLSKPTAAILPLVALPLVWLQWRYIPKRAWISLGIWAVLAIPICITAKCAQPAPYTLGIPIWRRFLVAGDAMAFYLFKIVWPKTLLLYYGRNPAYIMEHGFVWWTWIVPAALITVLWFNRRRCAPALAGMCVFVAALLPVLGFIGFNFQYYSTVSDRYLYLSMFGVALIAAWALEHLPRRCAVLTAVPLLLLAGRSAMQVRYWQDSLTLFGHVLESNPNSAVGNSAFASELVRRRDYSDAVGYARRAIQVDPYRCEPYDPLARALDGLGLTSEAVQAYRDGFHFDVMTRVFVSAYAVELLREGNPQHALVFARLAVEFVQRAEPYVNLGSALAETNDWRGARKALETAVSLDPRDYNAQCNLATVLDHLGDRAGAIAHYRAAESVNPDLPAARHSLERLTATTQP